MGELMNDIYLLYIGKGASIYGVPARNLSYEETSIAGEKRLIDSGLYKLSKSKEHRPYVRRSKMDIKEEVSNE